MADDKRLDVLPEGATVRLTVDGAEVQLNMLRRVFSSGSIGYHTQGKLDGADGRRYQLGITATVIGSKPVTK